MEYLQMNDIQLQRYIDAKDTDDEIQILSIKKEAFTNKPDSRMSSFMIKSRQATTNTFDFDSDTMDEKVDVGQYSIKFEKVINHIKNSQGTVIVFSFFVQKVLKVLEEFLEAEGIAAKLYTGEEGQDERSELITLFNKKSNTYGKDIKVLLISGAGAEGISLKRVRQVHILEPHWNETKIEQAIGRAVRLCSHNTLPEDERIVDVYRYFSIQNSLEGTIDNTVYNVAIAKIENDKDFVDLIKTSSVDCFPLQEINAIDSCYEALF